MNIVVSVSILIGVVVTAEEIKTKVAQILDQKKQELESKRYQIVGMLLGMVKKEIKWADQSLLKTEFDDQILALLGPKDERDDPKTVKLLIRKRRKRKYQKLLKNWQRVKNLCWKVKWPSSTNQVKTHNYQKKLCKNI